MIFMKIETNRAVMVWFTVAIALLLSWFFLQPPSLSAHLAIFIWIFTALVVFYLLKSFSFFIVQLGLGNPPYSIDDFSVLLSGLTLIFFAILGFRRLLFASAIPLLAVVSFQVYDKLRLALETLAEPLIPPVVHLSIFFLNLLGVGAHAEGNMIVFNTIQGGPVVIPIVFDCTGVESMSTFLLAAAVVFYLFRDMVLRKKLIFLAIGIIGTYIANIIRVVIICLSGYYYGPKGAIELVHIHTGWIIFAIWMFIFWYVFFVSYMKGLKRKGVKSKAKTRNKV
jgi:exosortase/archaeosortase family protein